VQRRVLPAWLVACGSIVVCTSCGSGSGAPQGAGDDAGMGGDATSGQDSAPMDGSSPPPDSGADGAVDGGPPGSLASQYPCDKGIAGDPAVVWAEGFEEGTPGAVTSRYDSAANPGGLTLVPDVPAKSCGKAAGRLTSSGDGPNATDLYKKTPSGYGEWYVRWYAKYQPGNVEWHHVGTWFGGYQPPTPYPNPMAGLKPNGDDRFSISIEPIYGVGTGAARFDTYDYWMQMHSWMDMPMGNTAYYGNAIINQKGFTVDEGSWVCIEVHVKLNSDPSSGAGAMFEVWKNDALVQHYDPQAPVGCWIKDKFCPQGADGPECTDYPNLCIKPYVPLGQQWRSTAALQLDYFWPQNYITQAGTTAWVQYDDMVVATKRVGCLQ
jgi:hypothetical protein